jgi:hypothetical protein
MTWSKFGRRGAALESPPEVIQMPGENGFIMRFERGKNIPTMTCETCGEIITDYRMAGVVWDREHDEPGRSGITVLCKGNECLSKPPHRGKPWMEMRDYMLWIAYNSGLSTEAQLRHDWEATERLNAFWKGRELRGWLFLVLDRFPLLTASIGPSPVIAISKLFAFDLHSWQISVIYNIFNGLWVKEKVAARHRPMPPLQDQAKWWEFLKNGLLGMIYCKGDTYFIVHSRFVPPNPSIRTKQKTYQEPIRSRWFPSEGLGLKWVEGLLVWWSAAEFYHL